MVELRARQGFTALGTAGVVALVATGFVVSSGGGSTAHADTTAVTTNTITVDGTGQAAGTPDSMITTIGVDSRGATPSAALNGANHAMAVVLATLRGHGVAAKDVKTVGLSVNPYYSYPKGQPTLKGYEASEATSVTLRNLGTAGGILSAVVKAGGKSVTIQQLSLDLESDSSLVTQARASAFASAKDKATQYAALAGRTLGPVVSVSEDSGAAQPQVYASAAAAAAPAGSVPVAAGSQNVSVDVTVVFSLQ